MARRIDRGSSRIIPVLKKMQPLLGVVLFVAALWILDRELMQYHLHDLFTHLHEMPFYRILFAFLAAGTSYFALMWYDMMGFYYIRHPIKFSQVAWAAFIGYTLSNNIGMAVFTGGSVRYRMYTAWGVSALKVTQIVVFSIVTFILGFLAISGFVFFLAPPIIPVTLNLSVLWTRVLGLVMLLLLGGYFLLANSRREQFRIWRWAIPLPTLRVAAGQVFVSIVDWMAAGAVLYVLLPSSDLNNFNYMAIFLLAQIIGVSSQVPGGLGVFESIMILLLSHYLPASSVLGSLMLFRGIYYLLPLILATVLLGAQELTLR
ncbi:MAG: lysylphosphatidylglycerol synthase domain-containing protein, partial [Calditrichota bacterium]